MVNQIKHQVVDYSALFREALRELLKNDPLRMAGATAFFTTFALPPILVILIQVFSLIIDPRTISVELFKSLNEIVGPETVRQIVGVLRNLRRLAQGWWVTIGGFVFLLFVATTLFKIIKSSINQIWKIRATRKPSVLKRLRTRVQSVLVILFAGVLLMVGIIAESAQALLGQYVFEISPQLSFYFSNALNYIVSLIIVTLWFAIVFRYLPDGRPHWKVALTGGVLTAILFNIGKIILRWLLSYSNINNVYGTSASLVLLLLFVFYSSLILYFGAAITKAWGEHHRLPIKALHHAVHYRIAEVEVEGEREEE